MKQRKDSSRSYKGQGLIEGILGMLIVIMVLVFLVMLSLNAYAAAIYSEKLKFVANTAANAYVKGHFFLGMVRPNFDDNAARVTSRQIVDTLLSEIGLPAATNVTFSSFATRSMFYSTVTITVNPLKLPFFATGVLPPFLGLTVTGQATEVPVSPYASLVVGLPSGPSFGRTQKTLSCAIPAYGYDVNVTNRVGHPLLMAPAPIGQRGPVIGPCDVIACDGVFQGSADPFLWSININEIGKSNVASIRPY